MGNLIAELLRAEGASGVHTQGNLVTHRAQKFWLSRDCTYVVRHLRKSINFQGLVFRS